MSLRRCLRGGRPTPKGGPVQQERSGTQRCATQQRTPRTGRSARCSSFTGARSLRDHQRSATLWWLNAATRVPSHAGPFATRCTHSPRRNAQPEDNASASLLAPPGLFPASQREVGRLTGSYCAVRSTLPLFSSDARVLTKLLLRKPLDRSAVRRAVGVIPVALSLPGFSRPDQRTAEDSGGLVRRAVGCHDGPRRIVTRR